MEKTKVCRCCGNTFTYDLLVKHHQCKDGVDSLCKRCDNAYRRERRAKNHDTYLQKTREYYNKNKERLHTNSHRYKNKHKERVQAASKDYWKRNPEKHRKSSDKWKQSRREKYNAAAKRWKENNKDKVSQYKNISQQRRLAKHKNLPRTLTTKGWEHCKNYFNNRCAYCGKDSTLTMDHYIPLSSNKCLGTVAENIVPACVSCNARKHAKQAEQWLYSLHDVHTAFHIICKINSYFFSLLIPSTFYIDILEWAEDPDRLGIYLALPHKFFHNDTTVPSLSEMEPR